MAYRPLPEADQKRITDLMWADARETLDEEYPCHCCCEEHTGPWFPARYWAGCRGMLPPGYVEDYDSGFVEEAK